MNPNNDNNNSNGYTSSPTDQCTSDEGFPFRPPTTAAPSLVSLLASTAMLQAPLSPSPLFPRNSSEEHQSLSDVLSTALDIVRDSPFDDFIYDDVFSGSERRMTSSSSSSTNGSKKPCSSSKRQ